MKTPRQYQESALQALFEDMMKKEKNMLCVAPVGAGKSLLIAELLKRIFAKKPDARALVITHVKELLVQNADELREQFPNADYGFYCASLKEKKLYNDITFGSVQSLSRKIFNINRPPNIILIDECFTGDTIISTKNGDKRVDEVRCGDIVYNATGCGEIEAISKKKSNQIYRIKLNDGREIRCTGNHPILSKQGWVAARQLEKGCELFSIQDMSELWKQFSSIQNDVEKTRKNRRMASRQKNICEAEVLLNILLKEDGKCNVDSRGQGKNVQYIKENRAQAIYNWWKWSSINRFSNKNDGNTWRGLGSGVTNKNTRRSQEWSLSKLLQGGYWEQESEISDRIGWGGTQWEKAIVGQEERREIDLVRVESVEVEKQDCGEYVYNLQVSGHPSYFANGILVHNCHLISHNDQTTYRKLIDKCRELNPNLIVIGFTGTPFRSDTGRLDEGKNRLFTKVSYEISMRFMIDEGFWVKPTTKNVSEKILDVSKSEKRIATRKGDYVEKQLQEFVNTEDKNRACVERILKHGVTRKKSLIFTAGVEHCINVYDEFIEQGENSVAYITGSKLCGNRSGSFAIIDGKELTNRDDIIKAYKADKIKYLLNVAVLTTGFNVPTIDMLVFMRPMKSPVLYIQCVGRGVRVVYANGFDLTTREGRLDAIANSVKPDCFILDLAGVVDNLGAIDELEIRKQPKEDGEAGEAPTKGCPSCGEKVHLSTRYCHSCGYEFISDKVAEIIKEGKGAVVSTDHEMVEYNIIKTIYSKHKKRGSPDDAPSTFKATYITDNPKVKLYEFICFDHQGGARTMAELWHFDRFPDKEPPFNVDEALTYNYPTPLKVQAQKQGKYYKVIKAYDFF